MKPNLPQLAFERDDMAPIAADLTLQIQSWQPDSKVSLKASLQNHQLKSSPQVDEPLPPLPACSEAGVHPTCEHSSQTPLNYIVNTSMEAPRRTQRLCAKKLLVCMVCGELQYSHSLEGVKAHIDEAHPHTLTLEPGEKERIREAWDEQVSRRERFFTSQLQQHSRPVAGTESGGQKASATAGRLQISYSLPHRSSRRLPSRGPNPGPAAEDSSNTSLGQRALQPGEEEQAQFRRLQERAANTHGRRLLLMATDGCREDPTPYTAPSCDCCINRAELN
uniref:SPIN-DOC-like zinc-finger domain-containing protein n=1 Tax=Amphilophus citrinellus TaxID=61819 RepID=A0A3Q0SGQ2_AMPCI